MIGRSVPSSNIQAIEIVTNELVNIWKYGEMVAVHVILITCCTLENLRRKGLLWRSDDVDDDDDVDDVDDVAN